MAAICVHAPVFKFCVQTTAEERKKSECRLSLLRSHIYWFRFSWAYISPNQTKTISSHIFFLAIFFATSCSLFSIFTSIKSMTEPQDIDTLVRMCQSGDRDALGILYQTYLDPMRKVVSYYVKNKEIVFDILHDGFLIAFASIASLKNAEKVEAWLTTIMKNLSLQYLKDESSHISVSTSDSEIADSVSAPIDEAQELTWEVLDKIIEKLPEGYGKVFRLAVLDGLSHKEIANLLGIAPHSSSSQLSHAKAMLRHMIKQYRMEMGLLSIIGIILLICYRAINRREETSSTPVISNN